MESPTVESKELRNLLKAILSRLEDVEIPNPATANPVPQVGETDAATHGSAPPGGLLSGVPVREAEESGAGGMLAPSPRIVEGYVRVTKSPDEMEAFLEIAPCAVTTYRLVAEGDPGARPRLKEETEFFCPADYEEVLALLEREGVCHGIDYARLEKLLRQPQYGTFKIASGLPPEDPTDETVELFFPREGFDAPGTGGVFRVFSVEPGTTLAVKKPGKPGKPGVSIGGRVLAPRPPRTVELVAGRGAELGPDGNTVVAQIAGRPCVEERDAVYVFTVNPVLVCTGDVAVATGGVHFRGDLEVHGNILDGASVYAAGSAEIRGFASYARIAVGGNLSIGGNVFASTIRAGCPAAHFTRDAGPLLTEVAANLQELAKLAKVLMANPRVQERGIPLGTLLLSLVEYRFPRLGQLVMQLCHTIRNTPGLARSALALVQDLERLFPSWKMLNIEDLSTLESLSAEVRFLRHCTENATAGKVKVSLPYALNARIESTGSVLVWGQGCYNTVIVADGNVDVNGIFRGGRIESRGNVYIREAGSELGVLTRIIVPGSKQVMLGLAYPGVIVGIGKHLVYFRHIYSQVKIVLGADRKVRVYGTRLGEENGTVCGESNRELV
ncbi:MAG: FapA family protein [Bacillota bacterium]